MFSYHDFPTMSQPLTALIARLDEAFAWLDVHPPTHPAERSAAEALAQLRAVIDAGLGPTAPDAAGAWLAWTAIGTEALAGALPEEDAELAGLVREIGALWRTLPPGPSGGRRRRRGPSPAPVFAISGGRPVRSVPMIDGGLDILAFDWATGRLVRDMSVLEAVDASADRDIDVVDVTSFYDTVSALRRGRGLPEPVAPTLASARDTAVDWLGTGEATRPYRAEVGGDEWEVAVNDWPDQPRVYTLIVNGRVAFDFDGWPDCWSRP